jgi:hypothetical protein
VELSTRYWEGVEQFDAAYLELARALIEEGRVGSIRDLMLVAGRHSDLWASAEGKNLLADLIVLLLEGLAEGHVHDVVPALAICPPTLAQAAIDLLQGAFFPRGTDIDPRRLDDAGLLCFALLTGATGQPGRAMAMIDGALATRYSEDFVHAAIVARDHLREACEA